ALGARARRGMDAGERAAHDEDGRLERDRLREHRRLDVFRRRVQICAVPGVEGSVRAARGIILTLALHGNSTEIAAPGSALRAPGRKKPIPAPGAPSLKLLS